MATTMNDAVKIEHDRIMATPDVHASAQDQLEGKHCLFCEKGGNPLASAITFPMYVKFCEAMKEHHGVTVSRALPIRIETPAPPA